jgi:hypothetical protein
MLVPSEAGLREQGAIDLLAARLAGVRWRLLGEMPIARPGS